MVPRSSFRGFHGSQSGRWYCRRLLPSVLLDPIVTMYCMRMNANTIRGLVVPGAATRASQANSHWSTLTRKELDLVTQTLQLVNGIIAMRCATLSLLVRVCIKFVSQLTPSEGADRFWRCALRNSHNIVYANRCHHYVWTCGAGRRHSGQPRQFALVHIYASRSVFSNNKQTVTVLFLYSYGAPKLLPQVPWQPERQL